MLTNKDLISASLIIILGIVYYLVRDYEGLFLALAWASGFYKEYFGKS